MATKKKAGTKAKGKPAGKGRKPAAGGDPIIIGGGGGFPKKPGVVVGTTISFNPGWYNHPGSSNHGHAGDRLSGLIITSGGGKTSSPVGTTSKLVVLFNQPPTPAVWIDGKNMTVTFTADFVEQRPGQYYSPNLSISKLTVDGGTRFTSTDGDCQIQADNAGTSKPKPKPKRKA